MVLNIMRYDMALPGQCARHVQKDLIGGADGLWLRLDKAARLSQFGKAGEEPFENKGLMAWDAAAWSESLEGVHLEMIETVLDMGENVLPNVAGFFAAAVDKGTEISKLRLNFGYDPIASLAREGLLIGDFGCISHNIKQLFDFSLSDVPLAKIFNINTEIYESSGATYSQQLGVMLATLKYYIKVCLDLGLSPSNVFSKTSLSFAINRDIFLEISKIRASRILWKKIVDEYSSELELPYIYTISSSQTISQFSPYTNMLRSTQQVFSGMLSGADAVINSCFDQAIGQSSEMARRISRNVSIILQEEAHLLQESDPVSGSYWVEENTELFVQEGWAFMQEIEARGGILTVLSDGWLQNQVRQSASETKSKIDSFRLDVTGVTTFPDLTEDLLVRRPFYGADEIEFAQSYKERLGPISMPKSASLKQLIDISLEGGTVFQLSESFSQSYEQPWKRCAPLKTYRNAEELEEIRLRSNEMANKVIGLYCLGPLDSYSESKDFAINFFATAGLILDESSHSSVVCVCGDVAQYSSEFLNFKQKLDQNTLLLVVGEFQPSISLLRKVQEALS